MAKRLVIVESPTKARTIEKFLGKEFEVAASYGHVRDLPDSASEIPEKLKKEKWARLGVNVDAKFEPLYIIPPDKQKRVKELKDLLKKCSELLLATDEDREGESISWHLLEVLNPKVPVKRLVFHEITKKAIADALDSAREVDENLVKAQETRRIIDRLFGYSVSPLLWKKVAPRLSAGRVQSVALRLLVERERERIAFREAPYWDLTAVFSKLGHSSADSKFEATLSQVGDKRVASGKDFDPSTGKLLEKSGVIYLDEKAANELRNRVLASMPQVQSVEEKPFTTRPAAPFTTSTLQQEASRKLGFAARRTMSVAQTLYENGFITYMRTDSTTLSEEALGGARTLIAREFGKEYLSDQPRLYKTKVKNAQEAHEAIRPAGSDFASMDAVRERLGAEAGRLYELIWKRTVASQMMDARGTRISVAIACADAVFRASGQTIEFPGFLRAYVEGSDDPEAELADREKILPKLSEGEKLAHVSLETVKHVTQPPARYTEGSLIKELERLGIGRPSTWATIVDVVLSRTYAFKKGSALVPTFLAEAIVGLLENHFTHLLDYEFTARLEDDLDAISRGEADSLSYLNGFYFGNGHLGLLPLVERGEKDIDPRKVCGIPIGEDSQGRQIEVRIGRYGPFLSNGTERASVPNDLVPDELKVGRAVELLAEAAKGPSALGTHAETGKAVYLKSGRFGPYIQLGEGGEGNEKPKMVSLLPGMTPQDVTFEIALKLLELPRDLGNHPELGAPVKVFLGRYGPYVQCGTESRSIPADDMSPLTITFEQAVALLKEPKRRGRTSQPKVMREIGKHPVSELPLVIKSGRYGPYVTDGKVNASLPRGMDPQEVTIEAAAGLLEARAAKIAADEEAGVKRGPKRKAAGKKKEAKEEEEKAEPKTKAKKKAAQKSGAKGAAKEARV